MNLRLALQSLFGRRPEQRAASASWTPMGPSWGLSGGHVTPAMAESVPTVMAALRAISEGVASLPIGLYRATPGGREEVLDHPYVRMTRRGPAPGLTWFEMIQFMTRQCLAYGNALLEVQTDQRGQLVGLVPHPWQDVSAQLVDDQIVFDITDTRAGIGGSGRQRRLLAYEVVHLQDFSDDALMGVSRLARASQAIEAALTMARYQRSFFANGARPSGILEHPGRLDPAVVERLRQQWNDMYSGTGNAGKTIILEEAMAYKTTSSTLEDSELVDAMRFCTEEIARIFGVPLPMLNIWTYSSFTNAQEAARWFGAHTLAPWCRRIESAFNNRLFSEQSGLFMEFDLSNLLRGSDVDRWACWKIAVEAGVLTVNEIRECEGWNARPVALSQAPPAADQSGQGQGGQA